MKKILIMTGKDYDDSEMLYPLFRLIEEGHMVDIASDVAGEICGKYHFKVNSMYKFNEVDEKEYDALFLPGGKAPERIRLNDSAVALVKEFFKSNKPVGAICHGQQLLISADVLNGKTATCYPGIKDDLKNAGANYKDEKVVVCDNLVTSRRPEDLPYLMKEFIKMIKN